MTAAPAPYFFQISDPVDFWLTMTSKGRYVVVVIRVWTADAAQSSRRRSNLRCAQRGSR